jgi:L-ascorbate metabolism protein UlaG (beta-lactamase superfamily)
MTPPLSDHFNGKTFFPPGGGGAGRFRDFLRWRLTSRPAPWPKWLEFPGSPPPPAPRGTELVATWLGHSTVLLQSAVGNFLTDPQFSPCAGPGGRIGPRRVHAPGIAFEALPRIDAVLLSHDHYDHCDLPSLRRLAAAHQPVFLAPLRHADLLQRAGARSVVELDWWQTHTPGEDVRVTLTPAQHWSNRLGSPRNHRLWGGFHLALGSRRVWYAGDSGYAGPLFREIAGRCGSPDLAFIPIGAYEPRWFMAPMHMNPAEAVATHRDVGAGRSIGIHWGTFQLTDESREAPVHALAAARSAAGLPESVFRVLIPGESVSA